MERLDIWRASVEKFNIPPGSHIDSFLKSQEEAILKGQSEADTTIILNGIDLSKGYVLINVYGPRPDEDVKDPSKGDPLIDFFLTARDHFYRWIDYYIDKGGKPQYKRVIESDCNRVPSPSFWIAGRFGECRYIIDQDPTFPDDFSFQFGYGRNDFRVSLERFNPDGITQAQFSAFYKAPNWLEDSYHVWRGEQPEIGNLQRIEAPSNFCCTYPRRMDIIHYEQVALERDSDWRRLVYEVSGSFAIETI